MDKNEILIEQYLLPFDNSLVSLVYELRQFLKSKTNPRYELVADSTLSLNIGYGYTKKAWDCFCGIIVYSKHINLSFPSGAFISDPKNLLIGTGKRVRHIKIANFDDITNPDVLDLIFAAKSKAFEKADDGNIDYKDVLTIVKPIKGIKKSP